MEDMTTWPVHELQLMIWQGTGEKIHRDQGNWAPKPNQQQIIDLGNAAEKELQRREALEGVCYERLT